ncbi:LytTR family DNA-binding domain-containing protein [Sphingomonas sp. 28-63-12]|uniref:LytTR family DNA-binding domain-containing protein n=1 Tax=Sphingomonas sp. 28-63-12 TaxID=1970434 RepID=UPI0035A823E5
MKRAAHWPGMPILPVATIAVTILLILVGGYRTGALPIGQRIGFWAILMTINAIKWQVWFLVMVRRPRDWLRALLIGVPLLTLTLPIEITAVLALIGIDARIGALGVWMTGLAMGAVILIIIALLRPRDRAVPAAATAGAAAAAGPTAIPLTALLTRAGIAQAADLVAIVAEDHYCRLHLAGGGSILLHHRFGDAVAEIAAIDGLQIHRGAWVAGHAVIGAVRDGRRWRVAVCTGLQLPVSARFTTAARARGWLRPPILGGVLPAH